MNYSTDFKMTGYKVLHPTIQLAKYLYLLAQVFFVVLVLHWAYMQSVNVGLLLTAVAILMGIYYVNWKL